MLCRGTKRLTLNDMKIQKEHKEMLKNLNQGSILQLIQAYGWVLKEASVFPEVYEYNHPDFKYHRLMIPKDPEAVDYEESIERSLRKISELQQVSYSSLLDALVQSDTTAEAEGGTPPGRLTGAARKERKSRLRSESEN